MLLSLSLALAAPCAPDDHVCEAVDHMLPSIEAGAGQSLFLEGGPARLRPARIHALLRGMVDQIERAGCQVDDVDLQWGGGTYAGTTFSGPQGDAGGVASSLSGNLVRVNHAFGGDYAGVPLAPGFGRYDRNGRFVADVDDPGRFFAGRWIRMRGATGVLVGLSGTCADPVDALDGYFGGGLADLFVVPVDLDGDGVFTPDDCDDADASVYPGAPEICDGRDNDCANGPDDGVGAAWFADLDGDGVGAGPSVLACAQPAGHVAADGDCDDADPGVAPGVPETCDGVDQDCDGVVDWGGFAPVIAAPASSIELPNGGNLDMGTGDFTVEAWVRNDAPGQSSRIFSNGSFGWSVGYMLRTTPGGQVLAELSDGVGIGVNCAGPVLPPNAWARVAGAFDRDGDVHVTVEPFGGVAQTVTCSIAGENGSVSNGTRATLGVNDAFFAEPFVGRIDEVRLWSRFVDPAEQALRSCAPLAGDEPDLAGYWPFETTFEDVSGNAGHAVPFDTVLVPID